LDLRCDLLHGLVLPEAKNRPPGGGKQGTCLEISFNVAVELRPPILAVRLRGTAVIRARVPEAPINEDGKSRTREGDIDPYAPAGESNIEVLPKPQAPGVETGS
jgi:hypothetical protein